MGYFARMMSGVSSHPLPGNTSRHYFLGHISFLAFKKYLINRDRFRNTQYFNPSWASVSIFSTPIRKSCNAIRLRSNLWTNEWILQGARHQTKWPAFHANALWKRPRLTIEFVGVILIEINIAQISNYVFPKKLDKLENRIYSRILTEAGIPGTLRSPIYGNKIGKTCKYKLRDNNKWKIWKFPTKYLSIYERHGSGYFYRTNCFK